MKKVFPFYDSLHNKNSLNLSFKCLLQIGVMWAIWCIWCNVDLNRILPKSKLAFAFFCRSEKFGRGLREIGVEAKQRVVMFAETRSGLNTFLFAHC